MSALRSTLSIFLLCAGLSTAGITPAAAPPIDTAAAPAAALAAAPAAAPIRIGDINSHNGMPAVAQAYRNGMALAADEINAAGGVHGRPLQLVARDDDGDATQAARHARELVRDEKVTVLTGSMLSNVALAVAREAQRGKTVFVVGDALSDAITLDRGNRYTFRVRPSTYMQAAMLAEQAARLPGRRWAVVAPNYEYGQSAVSSFKLLLKQARPDVEFVADQWPALGKIKADDVVRALRLAKPDAIFNATFGRDLQQLVQAGNRQQLFATSKVFSMTSADAQSLPLGAGEAIHDWVAVGYPWDQIGLAGHQRFVEAYLKKFSQRPQLSAVFGYTTMLAIGAALDKAGSTGSDALITALRGMQLDSPLGPIAFRALDQQASMGAFIGHVSQQDGRSTISQWHYLNGAEYMPDATYVRSRRPAAAMK